MTTPVKPAPERTAPYVPPTTITVEQPTFQIADPETALRQLVVILDVQTGVLHAEQWDDPHDFHEARPAYYPHRDLYFPGSHHEWWTRAPRHLGWPPRHYPKFPATEAGFTTVLTLMAPWAQQLVDALEPLPDGGYDWSLTATAAYERIGYLASYGTHGLLAKTEPDDPWHGDGTAPLPERHHYGAVSFDELLAAAGPDWPEPAWATMTDAQLDDVAESLTARWTSTSPHRKTIPGSADEKLKATIRFFKSFHADRTLAEDNQGLPIHVVGARAGLRRWRAAAIAATTQLPTQHAAAYLTAHPAAWPQTLRAATGDHELAQIADLLNAQVAQARHLALLSTAGVLREARAELRAMSRVQLAAAGDAYAALAAELRQLGDRRAALLHEVASFQEEPEWDAVLGEPRYAVLARLARMTRQAVRERLTDAAPPAEALDDDIAAAIREHLRETRKDLSAAQLYAHLTEGTPALTMSRARLDTVLERMVHAADVAKTGRVGATYYYSPHR